MITFRKGALYANGKGLSIYFPSAQDKDHSYPLKRSGTDEVPFNQPDSGSSGYSRGFAPRLEHLKYGPDEEPYGCRHFVRQNGGPGRRAAELHRGGPFVTESKGLVVVQLGCG